MQFRFHNFNRPLVSFDENLRLLGAISFGRLAGYDSVVFTGNTATISHNLTGVAWVKLDGSPGEIRSCAISANGTFIHEDAAIDVNVDFNAANAFERVDLLVLNHSFLASTGGSDAYYSVLKGADGLGFPSRGPAISQPTIQIPIGRFIVPANAANHNNTKYEPYEQKALGGMGAFLKQNETDVIDVTNGFEKSDFNRMIKSGLFMLTSTTNRPAGTSNDWMVIVLRRGVKITQLATGVATGKTYSRSSGDTGLTWGAWDGSSNSDVTALIAALTAAVGDLNYPNNNYILDGDSATIAISKLDGVLNTLYLMIGGRDYTQYTITNLVDFETITASLERLNIIIGDRANSGLGSQLRKITNGSNISAQLRGLDNAWDMLPDNENFNTGQSAVSIGVRYCSMGAVVNGPAGVASPSIVTTQYNANSVVIYQKVHHLLTGNIWIRVSTNSGVAWSAWTTGTEKTIKKIFDLPAWDMNNPISLVIITPPPAGVDPNKILGITARIRNDAGTDFYDLRNNGCGYTQWSPAGAGSIVFGSLDGGDFDTANFNDLSFSRGTYVVELLP